MLHKNGLFLLILWSSQTFYPNLHFLHGYIRHIRDISQLCKDVEDAVWWGAVAHQDDESSHWADFLANSIKRSWNISLGSNRTRMWIYLVVNKRISIFLSYATKRKIICCDQDWKSLWLPTVKIYLVDVVGSTNLSWYWWLLLLEMIV